MVFLNSGCLNRAQIRASLWMVWPVPKEYCDKTPGLERYGLFRKLNNGQYEFYSYCNLGQLKEKNHMFFAIYDDDLNAILDETLPKEK